MRLPRENTSSAVSGVRLRVVRNIELHLLCQRPPLASAGRLRNRCAAPRAARVVELAIAPVHPGTHPASPDTLPLSLVPMRSASLLTAVVAAAAASIAEHATPPGYRLYVVSESGDIVTQLS